MTTPSQGGPPPGEPGRSQPQQPWPQPQQPWPPPWPQQPGPWGPPAPGPYGSQPSHGQPPQGQSSPWAGPPHGALPYGQGHGPFPFGQQPRRARMRAGLGLAAVVVLVVATVVVARLLGTTVLDVGAVERNVAEQFEERYGVGVDLDCPAEMTVEPEAVYRCTGTTGDGEAVTLEIRITDVVRAAYTWEEV